mmetsp:Transcript_3923/g.11366  ORF Transcript_3923/g.11366 Transcript_3923/m.11366 type:complete len:270 (-) Transcript_3923:298-1107(-)
MPERGNEVSRGGLARRERKQRARGHGEERHVEEKHRRVQRPRLPDSLGCRRRLHELRLEHKLGGRWRLPQDARAARFFHPVVHLPFFLAAPSAGGCPDLANVRWLRPGRLDVGRSFLRRRFSGQKHVVKQLHGDGAGSLTDHRQAREDHAAVGHDHAIAYTSDGCAERDQEDGQKAHNRQPFAERRNGQEAHDDGLRRLDGLRERRRAAQEGQVCEGEVPAVGEARREEVAELRRVGGRQSEAAHHGVGDDRRYGGLVEAKEAHRRHVV